MASTLATVPVHAHAGERARVWARAEIRGVPAIHPEGVIHRRQIELAVEAIDLRRPPERVIELAGVTQCWRLAEWIRERIPAPEAVLEGAQRLAFRTVVRGASCHVAAAIPSRRVRLRQHDQSAPEAVTVLITFMVSVVIDRFAILRAHDDHRIRRHPPVHGRQVLVNEGRKRRKLTGLIWVDVGLCHKTAEAIIVEPGGLAGDICRRQNERQPAIVGCRGHERGGGFSRTWSALRLSTRPVREARLAGRRERFQQHERDTARNPSPARTTSTPGRPSAPSPPARTCASSGSASADFTRNRPRAKAQMNLISPSVTDTIALRLPEHFQSSRSPRAPSDHLWRPQRIDGYFLLD